MEFELKTIEIDGVLQDNYWTMPKLENEPKGLIIFARIRKPLSILSLPYCFEKMGVKPIK